MGQPLFLACLASVLVVVLGPPGLLSWAKRAGKDAYAGWQKANRGLKMLRDDLEGVIKLAAASTPEDMRADTLRNVLAALVAWGHKPPSPSPCSRAMLLERDGEGWSPLAIWRYKDADLEGILNQHLQDLEGVYSKAEAKAVPVGRHWTGPSRRAWLNMLPVGVGERPRGVLLLESRRAALGRDELDMARIVALVINLMIPLSAAGS